MIECLIGNDMIKFYLDANLNALISFMEQYMSRGEIIKFIINFDIFSEYYVNKNLSNSSKSILIDIMCDIIDFLYECFSQKSIMKQDKVSLLFHILFRHVKQYFMKDNISLYKEDYYKKLQ